MSNMMIQLEALFPDSFHFPGEAKHGGLSRESDNA